MRRVNADVDVHYFIFFKRSNSFYETNRLILMIKERFADIYKGRVIEEEPDDSITEVVKLKKIMDRKSTGVDLRKELLKWRFKLADGQEYCTQDILSALNIERQQFSKGCLIQFLFKCNDAGTSCQYLKIMLVKRASASIKTMVFQGNTII